jgi:hypothetical protein
MGRLEDLHCQAQQGKEPIGRCTAYAQNYRSGRPVGGDCSGKPGCKGTFPRRSDNYPFLQNFSLRSLTDMAPLTPSVYKLTVAGAEGIHQIAMRFGKKKENFDPAEKIEQLKTAIRTEREAMGLPALPSLK